MSCVYISPSGRHVRLRQYGNKRLIVRVTNMRGGFPFLRIPGIYLRGMPTRQSSLYDTINRKDLQAVAIRCKSDFEDTIKLTMLKPPSATKRTPVS